METALSRQLMKLVGTKSSTHKGLAERSKAGCLVWANPPAIGVNTAAILYTIACTIPSLL